MGKALAYVVLALGFVALIGALGLLFAIPIAYLLEYVFAPAVLTAVFGTATISVWKAWGISILFGLLFKSHVSSSK